ncbi:peptidase of plants and bacteria-domain-containing protein [Staphylotrichum tortipilum]|uniref:Peptidase of plants and bacteria-domain-containing protein n=1 Tax=Staphylotrichum tortipilum TaxID=2831512 RepID=A0AAN6RY97_9PEZI|nr:peptidase of plants and bacteria-domain-containing protein [Staphylotrichum longicolle]
MTLREHPSPAAPTSSPVPLPDRSRGSTEPSPDPAADSAAATSTEAEKFPQPKLRLKIHDLDHPGASKFLTSVDAATVVSTAVNNVLRLLYKTSSDRHTNCPPTRSVTLVLRDMDGVAYTTGTALDNDHKEIHFSLNYINSIRPASRLTDEITGVLTHELVHCYQWDAQGTCPGGLIEGVADWVRLNCDLSPPHWKRETEGSWDRGYQHTAYFLQYLEVRFGEGTVRRVNEGLRQRKYKAEYFWLELLGQSVDELYGDYVGKSEGDECNA